MTTRVFPSAAEIAQRTPADRDRAIDVIRIVSLIGVVAGHTIMATSIIDNDVFRWGNLLTASVVFQALTWVFQIMPLFFFAGVAASAASYRSGMSWGGWLLKRCTRLYRPVFYYLAFWATALLILKPLLPIHVYEPIAGISIQLLWFLGAYVMVLAAVPLAHGAEVAPRRLGGRERFRLFARPYLGAPRRRRRRAHPCWKGASTSRRCSRRSGSRRYTRSCTTPSSSSGAR